MTELEKLNQLPTSKQEVALFAERINEELESGNVDPLEILKQFKFFEKVFEAVKPKLDKLALSAVEKYPEKAVEKFGVKMSIRSVGVSYDYSTCGDAKYNLLKGYEDEYKAKVKERTEFLQTIKEKMEVVDEDSGEIYSIFPPVKKGKDSVIVNF